MQGTSLALIIFFLALSFVFFMFMVAVTRWVFVVPIVKELKRVQQKLDVVVDVLVDNANENANAVTQLEAISDSVMRMENGERELPETSSVQPE